MCAFKHYLATALVTCLLVARWLFHMLWKKKKIVECFLNISGSKNTESSISFLLFQYLIRWTISPSFSLLPSSLSYFFHYSHYWLLQIDLWCRLFLFLLPPYFWLWLQFLHSHHWFLHLLHYHLYIFKTWDLISKSSFTCLVHNVTTLCQLHWYFLIVLLWHCFDCSYQCSINIMLLLSNQFIYC